MIIILDGIFSQTHKIILKCTQKPACIVSWFCPWFLEICLKAFERYQSNINSAVSSVLILKLKQFHDIKINVDDGTTCLVQSVSPVCVQKIFGMSFYKCRWKRSKLLLKGTVYLMLFLIQIVLRVMSTNKIFFSEFVRQRWLGDDQWVFSIVIVLRKKGLEVIHLQSLSTLYLLPFKGT